MRGFFCNVTGADRVAAPASRGFRVWLLLALAIVVVMVVASFPARLALRFVVPADGEITLQDVSGSIWNGQAGRVLYRGEMQGQLRWSLRAWPLLMGRASGDFDLLDAQLSVSARFERSWNRVSAHNVRARLPASRFERMLDLPSLQLNGNVMIEVDELVLENRVPTALAGRARWTDAGVTGAEQAVFGTILATFGALPTGGFGGDVSDEGGPLAVKGHFKTTLLGFEAEARLQARDGNPQVTRALTHIGQVQEDGSVLFRVEGGLGR
jgi:general secretion pathway protein N